MTPLEFDASDVARADGMLSLTPFEAGLLAPDHPFLDHGCWRGFLVERGGRAIVRLVASVDPRQRSGAGPVGCLGFIRLGDGNAAEPPAADAARQVVASGRAWLLARGVATVRCPVQLSTWYGHRAMTGGFPDDGGLPQFGFEPPPDRVLPALLDSEGFRPAHRAVSCLVDSAVVAEQTDRAVTRFAAAGFFDRPLDLADLDGDLRVLHRLASDCFRGAWGLSDCTFEEFASIYRPIAGGLDRALVRILHDGDGQPVGFALGLAARPAAGAAQGGRPTFVLKSIGVTGVARRRHPGLGAAFTGMVHRAALDRGHAAGVHALMAEGSVAHHLSLRWGSPFRQYATFERDAA